MEKSGSLHKEIDVLGDLEKERDALRGQLEKAHGIGNGDIERDLKDRLEKVEFKIAVHGQKLDMKKSGLLFRDPALYECGQGQEEAQELKK